MSAQTEPGKDLASTSVAAVCSKHGSDAAEMDAFLASRQITVERYALRDLDGLDSDVREGRIGRVIFVRAEDLLTGVFNNEIQLCEWVRLGVRIEFLKRFEQEQTETTESEGNISVPSVSSCSNREAGIAPWLATTAIAWNRHRTNYRKRQLVAGAILGTIAIAAAFLVVLF